MQLDNIAKSLMEITAENPMAAALIEAGFGGGLYHGARVPRAAERPFGFFTVAETEREGNSSGVALVTYEIELTIVVDESVGVTGAILGVFNTYWGRIMSLPTLADPRDELVIQPISTGCEVGEADEKEFGKDVILGLASWTIRVSEHKPALE